MNQFLLRFLVAGALATALLGPVGCKKDAAPQQSPTVPSAPGEVGLTGAIVLPSGSPRDVNALKIVSPIAQGAIQNGRYQVATLKDEFTTQIAADAAGQPVLMGYSYPGQTDFTIDVRSTVLAMLMNTGSAYSLTAAGRQQLIPKIQADPAFAAAVQEIERVLRTPSAVLLDTTNIVLGNRVGELFTKVAHRTQASFGPAVRIDRAGRNMSFTNAGVPFANTVGIYKDGQPVQQLEVGGQNFFASSLSSLANATYTGLMPGSAAPSPASAAYTLTGDGQFDVRIRSGKFASSANGPEQRAALVNNLAQGAILLISGVLPQFKGGAGCAQAIATSAKNQAANFKGIASITTATNASVVIGKIAYGILKDAQTILQRCQPADADAVAKFSDHAASIFKWTDVLVARLGNGMNLTALSLTWMAYPAAQDTCFQASGSTVGPCTQLHLEAVSGDAQTGAVGTALPAPVRVRVIGADGSPKSGVTVSFNTGSGSATPPLATSDANGYAQATWTLGPTAGAQTLTATGRDAAGQPLTSAPVTFTATAGVERIISFRLGSAAADHGLPNSGSSGSEEIIFRNQQNQVAFDMKHVFADGSIPASVFTPKIPPGTYSGTYQWTNSSADYAQHFFDVALQFQPGGATGYYNLKILPPIPVDVNLVWGAGGCTGACNFLFRTSPGPIAQSGSLSLSLVVQ